MTDLVKITGNIIAYPEFSQIEKQSLISFAIDVFELDECDVAKFVRYTIHAWNEMGDAIYYPVQAGGEIQIEGWKTLQSVIDSEGCVVTKAVLTVHSFESCDPSSSDWFPEQETQRVARMAMLNRSLNQSVGELF